MRLTRNITKRNVWGKLGKRKKIKLDFADEIDTVVSTF